MKTAGKMARDAWAELDANDAYNYCLASLNHETVPKFIEKLLNEYGAQVREEAAKIVESKTLGRKDYGVMGLVDRKKGQASMTGDLIAAAIRKMDLP